MILLFLLSKRQNIIFFFLIFAVSYVNNKFLSNMIKRFWKREKSMFFCGKIEGRSCELNELYFSRIFCWFTTSLTLKYRYSLYRSFPLLYPNYHKFPPFPYGSLFKTSPFFTKKFSNQTAINKSNPRDPIIDFKVYPFLRFWFVITDWGGWREWDTKKKLFNKTEKGKKSIVHKALQNSVNYMEKERKKIVRVKKGHRVHDFYSLKY